MRRTYAIVFERGPRNYAAYCPDVPGCVSVGDDWGEMQAMIHEALGAHIGFMLERGEAAPEPTMSVEGAMRYHCDLVGGEGESEPATEVTVAFIEVEVSQAAPVRGEAASVGG